MDMAAILIVMYEGRVYCTLGFDVIAVHVRKAMHAELRMPDRLSTEIILRYNNSPTITEAKMAATAHFPFIKFLGIFLCEAVRERYSIL